ncbi:MAG TPA: hypothetical protein VHD83_20240 [Puia sp.]|nr:hypothetical protein [Puia sp.]
MKGVEFYVDAITNSIVDAVTRESIETDIAPITFHDLKKILKKNGWKFNWKKESQYPGRQLYKLVIRGDEVIQGLISVQILEKYVEMYLIETAPHNFGRKKKYIGVAANMVAFACKMSFEMGFEGYVGFRAKTKLIQHYIDTLGAELLFKDRMQISEKSAEKLVNSYFKDYLK